jgi:outer membrane protein assembly factor BamB
MGSAYLAGGDAGLVVFDAAGCGQPTCQPIWSGKTGPQAIATPALAGGFAYVPSQASFTSNDGRLNVFDARGCGAPVCRPVWTGIGGTESFLVSSPAVAGGVVFVAGFDGKVYAFDAGGCGSASCDPLWTGRAGAPIDSSPAVAGGVVYVGDTDGMLSAFPAGGCGSPACEPVWQGETGGSIDIASPTVAGGVVLVSGGDFLFAFDAAGCGQPVCQPLWKGAAELMSNTPAVSDGVVYVDAQPILQGGRSVGVIAAFDLDGCGAAPTCQPMWSGINFTTGFESSPVVANGVVYIGKGPATFVDAGIFAYDAAGCGKAICEPIAFVQTGPEQFYLSSTPAVVDGRVSMGSTETEGQAGLYVFDRP